jgi:hypothetical protein
MSINVYGKYEGGKMTEALFDILKERLCEVVAPGIDAYVMPKFNCVRFDSRVLPKSSIRFNITGSIVSAVRDIMAQGVAVEFAFNDEGENPWIGEYILAHVKQDYLLDASTVSKFDAVLNAGLCPMLLKVCGNNARAIGNVVFIAAESDAQK